MNLLFTNIAYADGVDDFIHNVNRLILNPLIQLVFAVALIVFLYGMVEFLINQESEEKKTAGKRHMLWGVIGMTIMFSVWGILTIVLDTFNITGIDPQKGTVELNDYNPDYPDIELEDPE